jgi:hypothetical protein
MTGPENTPNGIRNITLVNALYYTTRTLASGPHSCCVAPAWPSSGMAGASGTR